MQAANQGVEMVQGAAHSCMPRRRRPGPDAVRLLLEEAYRSNAGLTSPKFVFWTLLTVCWRSAWEQDRVGVVNSLIEEGELDQARRDVAQKSWWRPLGAVRVRADLSRALGGFSPGIGEPGEDLDLSWRAHVAGARVMVGPLRAAYAASRPKRRGCGPVRCSRPSR